MSRKTLLTILLSTLLLLGVGVGVAASLHTPQASAAPKASTNTIVDVALSVNAKSGEFSTLIAALECTGLVPTLNGNGQYTVFAPTDAAFLKLGLNKGNVCSTFSKAALTNILLYHVAHGSLFSGDVASATQIRMLNKEFTTVSSQNGSLYINKSKIVTADVAASNGVIHIIDSVLLP